MARFYAMIANGGKLVTPHLASDVEQPRSDRQPLHDPAAASARSRRRRSASTRPRCEYVQDGLVEATHSSIGTSSGVFGTFPVSIAGKTGTAEKLDHVCPATRTRSS